LPKSLRRNITIIAISIYKTYVQVNVEFIFPLLELNKSQKKQYEETTQLAQGPIAVTSVAIARFDPKQPTPE